MSLARAAGLPVIVVGDIDRGGVFAAMFGTLALLSPEDQALISGFVINKFRGAPELLDSGLSLLAAAHRPAGVRRAALAGRPVAGRRGLPGAERKHARLALSQGTHHAPFGTRDFLRVAVVKLPRISNFTDADALAAEPGVLVRFADRPAELADADLVVLPGSRATVADLAWLRERGLAGAITERARAGPAGAGHLRRIPDAGRRDRRPGGIAPGRVDGLGLLPVRVVFGPAKRLGRPAGRALGAPVAGYEIHHGIAEVTDPAGAAEPFLDGCRRGAVWGTSWHGVLENDEFRRAFLAEVAALAGPGLHARARHRLRRGAPGAAGRPG